MAGLEVLYHLVQAGIGSSQDAVVVLTHWEMIKHGLRCLGSGDQSSSDDRTSELLPAGWNDNQEVYTLRYRGDDGSHAHVLKAITVDSSLLFNLMNTTTQQVSELTVVIADHINEDQLHSFDRVYKDPKALSEQVRRHLVSPEERGGGGGRKKDKKAKTEQEDQRDDHDPLRIPTRHPRAGTHPHW